ncbi:hypothetical protein K8T06_15380 [bacterium]|nr:hypothetical protein [bacterium]
MEVWELFIKGLAKTFEEFAVKMIERGRDGERVNSQPKSNAKKSDTVESVATAKAKKKPVTYHKQENLNESILEIISKHPDGITLKEVANILDVQWHYLRIPFKQLTEEKKIRKDDKLYTAETALGKTSETIVKKKESKIPEKSVVKKKQVAIPEIKVEPKKPEKPAGPKRRVIDARDFEKKSAPKLVLPNMSIRDRERLRYRILTALRGRPEGLNIDKLSAVLGMELGVLNPILQELLSESKVVLEANGKHRLP